MPDLIFVKNSLRQTPPLSSPRTRSEPAWRGTLSEQDQASATSVISQWPGYAPTPLYTLPGLAGELGVQSIFYKDEGPRFGLGSFKAIGGGYAINQLLHRARQDGSTPEPSQITVCCATDGNHGRGVAWAAQFQGCKAVIFLPKQVSQAREDAIKAFGAETIRLDVAYDEAIRVADETARREGWIVISDTGYPGYMEIPNDVMAGYTVMANEAIEQILALSENTPPSHVFLQTGVGGMAAAVTAAVRCRWPGEAIHIVLVDPEQADCWYRSIAAGEAVEVHIEEETIMAGLSCGEISLPAWPVLSEEADGVIALPDMAAIACMNSLAHPKNGDRPIVAGESAVAGLAGLIAACGDPAGKDAFALNDRSRILVIGTEGATDPSLYTEIVGERPESVAERGRMHSRLGNQN